MTIQFVKVPIRRSLHVSRSL